MNLAKAFDAIDKTGKGLLSQLDSNIQSIITDAINEMYSGGNGSLQDTVDNRIILNRIRENIKNEIAWFISDNIADQFYFDNYLRGEAVPPQTEAFIDSFGIENKDGRFFAQAADATSQLARALYKDMSVDHNLMIADQLHRAAQNIMTYSNDQQRAVTEVIVKGFRNGLSMPDLAKEIENTGLTGLGPYVQKDMTTVYTSRAETILRGVTSELYQMHQIEIAKSLGEENVKYQLMGGYPVQGKNGHRICQRYYMKIFTWPEWVEIIKQYEGEAGLTPESAKKYGNNGYGCRHVYQVIHVDDVESVQADTDEIQSDYNEWSRLEAERVA